MSAIGLFGISNIKNPLTVDSQSARNSQAQQFGQEFQQLGQDLQSGNLAAAQTDLSTLLHLGPQSGTNPSTQSQDPLSQQFQQASQALQSGNLTAAQQGYTSILQGFQGLTALFRAHHHHAAGVGSTATTNAGQINQLFGQLAQALQSGSLSAAQQAYASLQQDFQQFAQGGPLPAPSATGTGALSVSA